jgi:copper chaperone CopZ
LEGGVNDDSSLNQGLMQTTTVELKDDGNADDLESGLGSMEGVRDVEVDGKTVSVTYDPTMIDENAIRTAIMDGGSAPLAGGGTAGNEGGNTGEEPFLFGFGDRDGS